MTVKWASHVAEMQRAQIDLFGAARQRLRRTGADAQIGGYLKSVWDKPWS
jgi:hypothetical protein